MTIETQGSIRDGRVFESRQVEVYPNHLETGDYIWSLGEKITAQHKFRRGSKWFYITSPDGSTQHKVPLGTKLKVQREFETDESRANRRRADENRMLRKLAEEEFDLAAENQKALEVFIEKYKEWGAAHYDHLDSLLAAEARNTQTNRFINALRYTLDQNPDADLVAFKDKYVRDLEHSVFDNLQLTSRSTSRMSNLIDDFRTEGAAKFVNEIQWMMLRADR